MSLNEKIALGTVQFGLDYGISNSNGKTSEEEVAAILDLASEHGIKILDTAQAYGSSEEVLGRHHQERFDIVTKINPTEDEPAAALIEKSLGSLNAETLYGVLFHNASAASKAPRAFNDLRNLQAEGFIRKVGFSVYTPQELMELIATFGVPDILQIPYSHLDRRFEELATKLHNQGVEIHTRSTFLQGLFFMKPDELAIFFNPIKPYLSILQDNFPTTGELAAFLLDYAASRTFVDKVVIGVNNARQLETNLVSIKDINPFSSIDVPLVPSQILMPNSWERN